MNKSRTPQTPSIPQPDREESNTVRFENFPGHQIRQMEDSIKHPNKRSEYRGIRFFDPHVADRLIEYANHNPGPPLPPGITREDYLLGIIRDHQLPNRDEINRLNRNKQPFRKLSKIVRPDFTPNPEYPELQIISRTPFQQQPLPNWAYVRKVLPPEKRYYNPHEGYLLKSIYRHYARYKPNIDSRFDIDNLRSSNPIYSEIPVYWKIKEITEEDERPSRETTILVGSDGLPIATAARVLGRGNQKDYRLADNIEWENQPEGVFYRGPKPREMRTNRMTPMQLNEWFVDHLQNNLQSNRSVDRER